jgi:hypothetical protein
LLGGGREALEGTRVETEGGEMDSIVTCPAAAFSISDYSTDRTALSVTKPGRASYRYSLLGKLTHSSNFIIIIRVARAGSEPSIRYIATTI